MRCCFTLRSGAAAALRLLARLDYQFIVSDQAPIWIRPVGDDVMAPVAHRLGDLLFREHLTLEGFYHCLMIHRVPRCAVNAASRSPACC